MEGFLMVIFLSITMLIGSFLSGMVPLTLSLSESKMRHITILGAGLLIGTALAVIIPEGVHSLYTQKAHKTHEPQMGAQHVHKRSIGDLGLSNTNLDASDRDKIEMFLNQLNKNKHLNTKLVKKRFDLDDDDMDEDFDDLIQKRSVSSDMDKINHFLEQIASDKNMFIPEPIRKRQTSTEDDSEAREIFDNQLKADKTMNTNKVLTKRDLSESQMSQEDLEKYQVFLNQLAADKNMRLPAVLRAKRDSAPTDEDMEKMRLFLNQLAADKNMNVPSVLSKRQVESEMSKEDLEKIEMFLKQLSAGRNNVFPRLLDRKRRETIEQKPLLNEARKEKDEAHTEHDSHAGENVAHSTIGITLVLGFIFMMFVDQIGGKFSHRPHQTLDVQSLRNKITFTTTLGLVVHSAADGVALGAAAATSKTDVEMIVFIAIMLHKAPASFGLVSFLIHEGLDRSRIRKHLTFFAMAAPILTIITFLLLKSHNDLSLVSSDSTGVCMLFSAGTFLYVSTVHVLPEVQAHNEDKQFKFAETLSFIVGALMPLVLSIGHSH